MNMNQLIARKPSKNLNPDCADLMTMGERELSAFFTVVTQLFGSKQAERSAEDWLEEMSATDGLPTSTREWQAITARVATQLAIQMNGSSRSTESVISGKRTCVFSVQAAQAS